MNRLTSSQLKVYTPISWTNKRKMCCCHAIKVHTVSRGTDPHILNFGTVWKEVVNFMPTRFTLAKEPRSTLDRRLCAPHKQMGLSFLENREYFFPAGMRTWTFQSVVNLWLKIPLSRKHLPVSDKARDTQKLDWILYYSKSGRKTKDASRSVRMVECIYRSGNV
jgi:hypothetical protein